MSEININVTKPLYHTVTFVKLLVSRASIWNDRSNFPHSKNNRVHVSDVRGTVYCMVEPYAVLDVT